MEVADWDTSLCCAETLSISGDHKDFARIIHVLQRAESRFPFLEDVYWDGVYTRFHPRILSLEVYPVIIAKTPISLYRRHSRFIELWVRAPARSDDSDRVKWIRVEWDMGHPDLSRISSPRASQAVYGYLLN